MLSNNISLSSQNSNTLRFCKDVINVFNSVYSTDTEFFSTILNNVVMWDFNSALVRLRKSKSELLFP